MNWGSREECRCPSTAWEGKVFDLGCIRKKYSIRCHISRSKTRYSASTQIVFQSSQGLIQMNWGSREECHCSSTVWEGKNFWHRWFTKKVLDRLSNFSLKNSLYSVSTLIAFVKDLFKLLLSRTYSNELRFYGGVSLPEYSLRGKEFLI